MEYRPLGNSALKVSPLCLGAMMFGGPCDEETSARIIANAGDVGVNFIDIADVYEGGASEEVVGRAVKSRRDYWVLASKFGYGRRDGPNQSGHSRKWIMQAVEASLKRLGTDYLDILYFHCSDPNAPLEESLRAIDDLICQGKILYYGLSNFRGWRIAEVCRIADKLNMARPIVSQPLYNILDRSAEAEQIPAASHYGLGVVPYSPLARGVLSGKYAGGKAPEGSRAARGDVRMAQTEWREESFAIAQKVAERAAELGTGSIEYSLAWILRNKVITAAIAGPRTLEQWEVYLRALDVKLGDEDEAFIDGLVASGHPSQLGYTDPAYPIEGRLELR